MDFGEKRPKWRVEVAKRMVQALLLWRDTNTMPYISRSELAELYRVSVGTIKNWIGHFDGTYPEQSGSGLSLAISGSGSRASRLHLHAT